MKFATGLVRILLLVLISTSGCLAQEQKITESLDTIKPAPHFKIRIFSTQSNRVFVLDTGRHVRVYCTSKRNGLTKLKRAKIIYISQEQIEFKPFSKRYQNSTYATFESINQQDLKYIEFTTPWSVVGGLVEDALIISGVVIVAAVTLIVLAVPMALTKTDPSDWIPNMSGGPKLPFSNLRKHIKFGDPSPWRFMIIKMQSPNS